MLYRLIESLMQRLPLPIGAGRFVVLSVVALLTAAAAGLGIPRLSITDLSGLFDPADSGEQRYATYQAQFDHTHEAIVLIDTGEHGHNENRAVEAAIALGESLEQERKVAAVHWGLNPSKVSPKLIRTLPLDDVQKITTSIAQLRPLLDSETPTALLQAGMAEAMRGAMQTRADRGDADSESMAEGAAVFAGLMDTFTLRMQTPADEPVDMWMALKSAAGQPDWELLRTTSGRLLVLRVELLEGVDDQAGYAGSLAALRRQIEAVRLRFESVEMGITGFEPTRQEAETVIRAASMRAAGGAVLALLLLTGLAWRNVWLPVVVVMVPGIAVTWTLGLTGLVLGQVNPLAMVGVVCAGLASLYGGLMLNGVWARGENRRTAIVAVGPVLTLAGGVVAVLGGWLVVRDEQALFGLFSPNLMGLRETGFVAVTGIMVAWGVVLLVGPALLPELRRQRSANHESRGEMARALAAAAARRPRVAWAATAVMILAVAISATYTPRSADTSGFLPEDTEGAVWQKRALVQGGEWGMPLSIIAQGMEEANALTAKLRALPEVARVTGIGRLIPEDRVEKDVILRGLDTAIGASARSAAALTLERGKATNDPAGSSMALIEQIRLIRAGLDFLPGSVKEDLGHTEAKMKASADGFLATANELDTTARDARLLALHRDYTAARRQAGELVGGLIDPAALNLADLRSSGGLFDSWFHLPINQTDHFQALFRIKVFPSAGMRGWPSAGAIGDFYNEVLKIDPQATGTLDRLLIRSQAFAAASAVLVLIAGLALVLIFAVFGVGWRGWLGGAVAVMTSALALVAAIGWLSQPMTALAWSVWPIVGILGVLWTATCARSRASNTGLAGLRQAAGGEAFGLVLAAGFVASAGLRSAGAPGLTATAVAACLAVGLMGLWVLLVVPGNLDDPRSEISS